MAASANARAGDLVAGGGRDLETLKREVEHRAERNMPPLGGISAEDARAALSGIDSLGRDAWARAWSGVAARYEDEAREIGVRLEFQNDRRYSSLTPISPISARAAKAWWNAWRLHHFARWPTENASAKQEAKARALNAFREYARLLEPPIEVVRIPFDGGEIVAYLRLPAGVQRAPLVFAIAGLDSRKEDFAGHTEGYLKRGIGVFTVDLPGTGESPIAPAKPDSDRLFSVALDYLATRADIDAGRIVVQGRSWSGYWAAKLAVTERERLRGAIMHGGPIHGYFQPDWIRRSLSTGEYLYDYLEAKCAMFGGASVEELVERARGFSLLDLGLLDEPSAPMLLVNGALDSQVPISDLYLLLEHGDAKEAWVNPRGGHMGRSIEWPPSAISEKVLMPWIVRRMKD